MQIETRINNNYFFILFTLSFIYIITYAWSISQHFSWWVILGEGNFIPQYYIYTFKSFKSYVFIFASILALFLGENKIKSNSVAANHTNQTLYIENVKILFESRKTGIYKRSSLKKKG